MTGITGNRRPDRKRGLATPKALTPRDSNPERSGKVGVSHAIHPRKRFGQHFLTDSNILNKLVRAAEVQKGEVVLEIGPGLGHLTRALLDAGANVVAVEIDRELAARLAAENRKRSALTVHEGDFLSADPTEWLMAGGYTNSTYKVVANLPYNITSAVLRHLLEAKHQPELIAVMVQREVALELAAKPGHLSLLALSVQFYGSARLVSHVPAGAFYPRPKVDSAIILIKVDHPSRFPGTDPARFFFIARAGFGVKRKQLHNGLARGLKLSQEEVSLRLRRAGVDPRRRAETLSVEEWHRVYLSFS